MIEFKGLESVQNSAGQNNSLTLEKTISKNYTNDKNNLKLSN